MTALERAVRFLSKRRLTSFELKKKLKDREYPEAQIEETIKRLLELKYLDDASALKDWAVELSGYRDTSRKRAIQKLTKRGFSFDEAARAIDAVWDDSIEADHARYLFEKLVKRHKLESGSDQKTIGKIWRSLFGKGYESSLIRMLLDEYLAN